MTVIQSSPPVNSRPQKLIVLGKPGAGKSTLTHRLSRELGLRLIAIGNIARLEAAEGTELGLRAAPYLVNMLLPAKLVGELLARELADPEVRDKGFLLDWTPRNINDLENLCSIFADYRMVPELAIYVQVSDAVVKERILQHRAVQEKRISDTEEIVDERLRQFADTAQQIIDRICRAGIKYRTIDGEKDHETVFQSFLDCLNPVTELGRCRLQSRDCSPDSFTSEPSV